MRNTTRQHLLAAGALLAVALLAVPPASSLAFTAPTAPTLAPEPTVGALAADLKALDQQARELALTQGGACVATDPVPGLLVRAGISKFTEVIIVSDMKIVARAVGWSGPMSVVAVSANTSLLNYFMERKIPFLQSSET